MVDGLINDPHALCCCPLPGCLAVVSQILQQIIHTADITIFVTKLLNEHFSTITLKFI